MDRFINDQLLAAYVYFGIPRLKGASMPLFTDYYIEPSKALRKTLSLGSDGNNKYPLLSIPAAEFKTRAEKVLVVPLMPDISLHSLVQLHFFFHRSHQLFRRAEN